jgi:hypothetical protein
MKNIFFTLTLLLFFNSVNAQGLKLEPEKYKSFEKWTPPESMGFSSASLPSKISFRSYCPMPNHQGQVSNCVGWAVAYAALSTQLNIDMGTTNYMHKWARAFDPNFIYNFVKHEGDYWCNAGSSLSDAMDVLQKFGCKPMVWDPWLKCEDKGTYSDFTIALGAQYKIKDWYAVPNENFVQNTKIALSSKFPVVIGVKLTESFEQGAAVSYGYWNPKAGETFTGAHAMCVIGYDDNKYGGAFEVMNSWGKDWGDKGFVWIKYADFENLVYEAYLMLTQTYKRDACSFGDCYNSYSRYKFKDGSIYEGIIENGLLDAYGSMLYPNGSFYVGGWSVGRKNGWGMLYDAPTGHFFDTYYVNDVLTEYSDRSFGFAQSESDKKGKAHLDELKKNMLGTEKTITDFDQTKKALQEYEAPDEPFKIDKAK